MLSKSLILLNKYYKIIMKSFNIIKYYYSYLKDLCFIFIIFFREIMNKIKIVKYYLK